MVTGAPDLHGDVMPWELSSAMSMAVLTTLVNEACDQAESGAGALVLRFTGGPDATAWPGEVDIRAVTRWERALRRLERSPCRTVSGLSGALGPAAIELLLTTDWRIATADAVLPPRSGHWPSTALYRMVHQLGVTPTRRLLHRPTSLGATEAVALGLFDEVVGGDAELAGALAEFAFHDPVDDPGVLRQLLDEAPAAQYDDALGVHLAACDRQLRRQLLPALAERLSESETQL